MRKLLTSCNGIPKPAKKAALSNSGDQLIIYADDFVGGTRGIKQLSPESVVHLDAQVTQVMALLRKAAGLDASLQVPWENIDDEQFEELGWEVLYHSTRFDRTTLRKMGKARSRDGGRDIVVQDLPLPRQTPCKFIFQCKLLRGTDSLTASRVLDITDTVPRFGAGGYGIITNGVIDAELYNKLDGLKQNHGIETVTYDGHQLERFLAVRREVFARFFAP